MDGYHSYFQLIENDYNSYDYIVFPGGAALIYTFVFPFLKNAIYAFNEWILNWGTAWSLRISKDAKVPVSELIDLKTTYKERTKALEEIIDSQSEVKKNNGDLTDKLNEATRTLSLWDKQNTRHFLNGLWRVAITDPHEIQNLTANVHDNFIELLTNEGSPVVTYEIVKIAGNLNSGDTIVLLTQRPDSNVNWQQRMCLIFTPVESTSKAYTATSFEGTSKFNFSFYRPNEA